MKYFLDTEFNEFGGELISLALVGEDGTELYLATECKAPGAWVAKNVMPIVSVEGARPEFIAPNQFGRRIQEFLGPKQAWIIADWQDDVRYLCASLIVGPGLMVNIPGLDITIARVDAYPTTLTDAVQHNALWDARALKHRILP